MRITAEERFWNKVNKRGPMPEEYTGLSTRCWLYIGCRVDGYGVFYDYGPHKAHRYSYELKHGKGSLGRKCCLHKCDTPGCVRPGHLFKGTKQDNSDDKCIKGRQDCGRGEKVNTHKLVAEDVLKIRRLYKKGRSQRYLATRFGVSFNQINLIVRRKNWRHI